MRITASILKTSFSNSANVSVQAYKNTGTLCISDSCWFDLDFFLMYNEFELS